MIGQEKNWPTHYMLVRHVTQSTGSAECSIDFISSPLFLDLVRARTFATDATGTKTGKSQDISR